MIIAQQVHSPPLTSWQTFLVARQHTPYNGGLTTPTQFHGSTPVYIGNAAKD